MRAHRLAVAACLLALGAGAQDLSPARVPACPRVHQERAGRRSRARTATWPRPRPIPSSRARPGQPWPVYLSAATRTARASSSDLARVMDPRAARHRRAARAAGGPRADHRARAALPAAAVRRARRPLQRDVRLGQLLHPGRPAARRRGRARPRHGRQLPLRDRPLRHDPQREPHVLPHALAAAVPDADGAGRLRADARQASGWRRTLPAIETYYRFWTTRAAPDAGAPACRATTTSATGPAPEVVSATRRTPRAARTTTACASTTARTTVDATTTSTVYYDRKTDRLTDALLQGRPLDARVGLRPVRPLRPVQRRHHPLRSRLPELAALPDGDATPRRS